MKVSVCCEFGRLSGEVAGKDGDHHDDDNEKVNGIKV